LSNYKEEEVLDLQQEVMEQLDLEPGDSTDMVTDPTKVREIIEQAPMEAQRTQGTLQMVEIVEHDSTGLMLQMESIDRRQAT